MLAVLLHVRGEVVLGLGERVGRITPALFEALGMIAGLTACDCIAIARLGLFLLLGKLGSDARHNEQQREAQSAGGSVSGGGGLIFGMDNYIYLS